MKTEMEAAIKALADKAQKESKAGDAMQLSQAALNLAHALATVENINKQK